MESLLLKLINIIVLTLVISACSTTTIKTNVPPIESADTVFYLTRHAEKEKSAGKDPLLSEQGQARAIALSELLKDVSIQHIYATKYQRTQLTAAPTALSKKLDVSISALPTQLLAAKLIKLHKDETVLVVGHSNTIPEIVNALGVSQEIKIHHDQYGDLFIVALTNSGEVTMDIKKFGDVK